MKVLVLNNFDSFVYNLVHYLEELGSEVTVRNNKEIELEEVGDFDKILLSPGPGIPVEAGKMMEIVRKFAPAKSILGVCLGQQAIGEVFGGRLENLDRVFHGEAASVSILTDDEPMFNSIPKIFEAGRYHSWIVSEDNFPEELEITSIDENGKIMSLRHREYDVRGVQFHPESILTSFGKKMLENWLKI